MEKVDGKNVFLVLVAFLVAVGEDWEIGIGPKDVDIAFGIVDKKVVFEGINIYFLVVFDRVEHHRHMVWIEVRDFNNVLLTHSH